MKGDIKWESVEDNTFIVFILFQMSNIAKEMAIDIYA